MIRNKPVFSIIVPSYNRAEYLDNLLVSLNDAESAPGIFEVIVIDDGSAPPLYLEQQRYKFSITLLRQKNSGPAHARNSGALLARGNYLLFTDDDCIPSPHWLAAFLEAIRQQPDAVLAGLTLNGLPDNCFSQATQLLFNYLHQYRQPDEHPHGFYTTNNLCIPKTIFLELKGFNSELRFGEDRELCSRLIERGKPFRCIDDALVFHFHNLTFTGFLKLHFQYGTGTYNFYSLAQSQQSGETLHISPGFYIKLILSPFRRYSLPKAVQLSVLLFMTQLSNLAGYFWEVCSQKLAFNNHLP